MTAFLAAFEERLAAISPEEFERHKAALVAGKLTRDRNLSDEAERHWGHIISGRLDFLAREEEVAELERLALGDVLVSGVQARLHRSPRCLLRAECLLLKHCTCKKILRSMPSWLVAGVVPGAHCRHHERKLAQAVCARVPAAARRGGQGRQRPNCARRDNSGRCRKQCFTCGHPGEQARAIWHQPHGCMCRCCWGRRAAIELQDHR